MLICIEVYAIRNLYVGVGEFCMNLGLNIAKKARYLNQKYGIELCFIVPWGYSGVFGNEVKYIQIPHLLKPFLRFMPIRIDLLHLTHQYCSFNHFSKYRNGLLTIHDINFVYEKKGSKLIKYTRRLESQIKKATHVNYISNFTRNDVEKHFEIGKETRVIYNGVSKLNNINKVSAEFLKKLPPKPFFFHISSLRKKKNVHLLIQMMQYLPDEFLVIAGNWKGDYGSQLKHLINELNLKNITCLDNVNNEEKAYLYANCKSFFFPSACEGFGLPPIEAMYMGKPVYLSTQTSLPEIGGEAAYYWNNLTPTIMAQEVKMHLESGNDNLVMSEELKKSASRFDWEKCANEYINYYLHILNISE